MLLIVGLGTEGKLPPQIAYPRKKEKESERREVKKRERGRGGREGERGGRSTARTDVI